MESENGDWEALTPGVLDKMEILSMVDLYVAGLCFGRVYALKMAFHENAVVYGLSADVITRERVQDLYETIGEGEASLNITSEKSVLHQTANTALVLVEMRNITFSQNITEHLSMMKIDGDWKIVSKAYNQSKID